MANCINKKSPEFQALLANVRKSSPIEGAFSTEASIDILAARVSIWQDLNGLNKFPSPQEMLKTNWKKKESMSNSIYELEQRGITSIRAIQPGMKTAFHSFHNNLVAQMNKAYGFNFKELFTVETVIKEGSFDGKFPRKVSERIIPNKQAFEAIDAKRKELGLYEDGFPFSALEEAKKVEYTSDQALEDVENSDLVYNGEQYHSREAFEADMQAGEQLTLFMGATYSATNYASVVSFKQSVLKTVETRLKDAQQKRSTDKSVELKQEVKDLTNLKAKLNRDISELMNDPDIFSKTMSVFNQDIAFMKNLIRKGRLEDLHLAEDYVQYFKNISNYSGSNTSNTFIVDTSDPNLIEPAIRQKLDELTVEVQNAEGAIITAKKDYLLQIIEESDALKGMFGDNAEEVRDLLLGIDKNGEQTQKDIDKLSKYFLATDFTFGGASELLGQLIVNVLKDKKSTNKVEANKYMQAISKLEAGVKAELSKLGQGVTYFSKLPFIGKHISEVSYDLFYQITSKGNKTGRLVGKYAHKWFHDISFFNKDILNRLDAAIAAGDGIKANEILAEKYKGLAERVDFIELQKLPEIINNPEFAVFAPYFDKAGANAYSAELKAKIGNYEYKKLVEQQTVFLEDYLYGITEDLNQLMNLHGVTTPADLPMPVVHHHNITVRRKNPFEFIKSHTSGHLPDRGKITYTTGTSTNEYQALITHNTYIPKKEIQKYNSVANQIFTEDSGYYDENFNTIESNPTLLEFWETMSDAVEWMNNSLNDANTPLSHNSLLRMEQSFTDILLSKKIGVGAKAVHLFRSTGKTLKDLFTKQIRSISAEQKETVAAQNIKTIQGPVNKRMKIILMALSNELGTQLSTTSKINLDTISAKTTKIIQDVMQTPINTIRAEFGTEFPLTALREVLTDQVMEEQTFNLPVMLRAYLDATGTYRAQKESLPKISILKDLYDRIKLAKENPNASVLPTVTAKVFKRKVTKEGDISNTRVNAIERMNYWIERAVKNRAEEGLTDTAYYWAKLGKTYTKEEKMFLEQAKEYLKQLQDKIDANDPNDDIEALQNEAMEIQHIVDNTGHYYALSAAYEAIANKLMVFKGLAWNAPAQVMNRFQGLHSALINDTGRFWTQGNIYGAMAFVNRKGIRRIPGMSSYREEVSKVKLLVEMLGVLQDATNELDRAQNTSGITGLKKKLNPFYLTEYVEWHNQVPMILAMLADHHIQVPNILDANGEPVYIPIFNDSTKKVVLNDGSTYTIPYGLPAYSLKQGRLTLKPEFDTPENNETWMDFSSSEGNQIYNKIDTSLAYINGDYRKDAAILLKKTPIGKSALTFKSWAAMNYHNRFARKATNINLGLKDFDGAYTGAMTSGKTSIAGAFGMASIAGAGVIAGGTFGLFAGGAIATGLIGYGAWKAINYKKHEQEEIKALLQMTAMGQALLKKAIGVPVNLVSGKDIIKAHTFNELNLTPQERQNLQFIIGEMTNLAYALLLKILYKSLAGDDEEEEPKTVLNSQGKRVPNPLYGKEEKTILEKGLYNLQENMLTDFIQQSTQFVNPMESWELASAPAALDSWFTTSTKIGTALWKSANGEPTLQTGPNAGKNRIGVAAVKGFLPGVIGEYILLSDDEEAMPYAFGFGNKMSQEWNSSEIVDDWFTSDYKKDRKIFKERRKELKDDLTKYWEKEWKERLEKNKDNPVKLDKIKAKIDKKVKREVNSTLPYPNRALYDKDQQLKD
jgi:hypothetical protein